MHPRENSLLVYPKIIAEVTAEYQNNCSESFKLTQYYHPSIVYGLYTCANSQTPSFPVSPNTGGLGIRFQEQVPNGL